MPMLPFVIAFLLFRLFRSRNAFTEAFVRAEEVRRRARLGRKLLPSVTDP